MSERAPPAPPAASRPPRLAFDRRPAYGRENPARSHGNPKTRAFARSAVVKVRSPLRAGAAKRLRGKPGHTGTVLTVLYCLYCRGVSRHGRLPRPTHTTCGRPSPYRPRREKRFPQEPPRSTGAPWDFAPGISSQEARCGRLCVSARSSIHTPSPTLFPSAVHTSVTHPPPFLTETLCYMYRVL